jgi:hypothetical protein
MWYTLDENNKPVASSAIEYSRWMEQNPTKKALKQEYIGDIYVSTVFLGLDHSWPEDESKPLLWETMIFGGEYDQFMDRYTSVEDALEGHQKAIDLVNSKNV